uniref:Uncharacterized protein n=1 Tax=uncultured marine virus TaxID=186617 RepID=A0A0F7LAN1_9VIRU|nr:hypothetical protein Haur_0541 [uncultured marine virus]
MRRLQFVPSLAGDDLSPAGVDRRESCEAGPRRPRQLQLASGAPGSLDRLRCQPRSIDVVINVARLRRGLRVVHLGRIMIGAGQRLDRPGNDLVGVRLRDLMTALSELVGLLDRVVGHALPGEGINRRRVQVGDRSKLVGVFVRPQPVVRRRCRDTDFAHDPRLPAPVGQVFPHGRQELPEFDYVLGSAPQNGFDLDGRRLNDFDRCLVLDRRIIPHEHRRLDFGERFHRTPADWSVSGPNKRSSTATWSGAVHPSGLMIFPSCRRRHFPSAPIFRRFAKSTSR